jgi:hypothetical protein
MRLVELQYAEKVIRVNPDRVAALLPEWDPDGKIHFTVILLDGGSQLRVNEPIAQVTLALLGFEAEDQIADRVEVFTGEDGPRWRIMAGNHEILSSSEAYSSRRATLDTAEPLARQLRVPVVTHKSW